MTKRRPIWKILAIIVGVLVVVAGSAALWIRSAADRKFLAMQDKLQALAAEARVPDGAPRPGSEPGNAWDDYALAFTEASKLKQPDKLIGILAKTTNADHAFGEAALAAHGSAVDHLLRGTRRSRCLPATSAAVRNLWHWETAVRLAILRARNLMKEGKTAEAIEIHLALCQLGKDFSDSGESYPSGYVIPALNRAFEELRGDLSAPSIPPAAIEAIESRLELLDAAFPRNEKMRSQRLRWLGEHYSNVVQYSGLYGSMTCWRFGFSTRLMAGRAFECWDHWYRRSAETDRLPWLEARALTAGIRTEIDRTHFLNEASDFGPGFLDDGSWHRSAQAHLRLLRTAVRYRRTGEVLDLDDPFGTKLLHQVNGGRLKVWSVGIDGVDQQGKGNWDSRVIEDVVLEISR